MNDFSPIAGSSVQTPAEVTQTSPDVTRKPHDGATGRMPAARQPLESAVIHNLLDIERGWPRPDIFSADLPAAAQAGQAAAVQPALVSWPQSLLGLPPKECLYWAQSCLDTLQRPADAAARAVWLQRLGECLANLGCEQQPLTEERRLIDHHLNAAASEQPTPGLAADLARVQASLQQLTQLHPSLRVPEIRTPAEFGAFLQQYLLLCIRELQAGHVSGALAFLAAMREAGWKFDPSQAGYPRLFQAIRQLDDSLWHRQPWQTHVDGLRRAIQEVRSQRPGAHERGALEALAQTQDTQETEETAETKAVAGPAPVAAAVRPLPDEWPAGSLVPDVMQFLREMDIRSPSCSQAKKIKLLMEKFQLTKRLATCLLDLANHKDNIPQTVHALCWNVTQEMPLTEMTSREYSTKALNALVDYQRTKAQEKGRPIPAPTAKDFAACDNNTRAYVKAWGNVCWDIVDIEQSKFCKHTKAINEALAKADAYEALGKYLRVSDFLEKDAVYSNHNRNQVSRFNVHANIYIKLGPGNVTSDSWVALRENVLQHSEVENMILAGMRQPDLAGNIFKPEFFNYMGYPPAYIKYRMDEMLRKELLVKVRGKGFSLAPPAAGEDIDVPASRPRMESSASGSSASDSRPGTPDMSGPPAKKSRDDRPRTATS